MPVAIAFIVLGFTLIYSALKGLSLTETLSGTIGDSLNPKGGKPATATGSDTTLPGGGPLNYSGIGPKGVIDNIVLPLARKHGIDVTPESVTAANGRHGPTVTGGRSDHQGPADKAWAADMSNGTHPTPEMDALAASLAKEFNISWSGSGLVSKTSGGYRYQLIYRTLQGGNHFNHVHFGVRRV